jgi:hypothetical protein
VTLECTCSDWQPNIAKVNAPLMMMHARNPHQGNMYRGVPFRYCPWCAEPLIDVESEQSASTVALKDSPGG